MAPTWRINPAIPFATNTPAQDQPGMKTNFNNIVGFLSVDHTAPDNNSAGQHNKVTITTTSAPATQVNPQSIMYTSPGIADSSIVELFYKNSRFNDPQIGFALSAIRGFAVFNGTSSGVITPGLGWNVASITKVSTGVYNVVMQSGVVSSTNFLVFCTAGVVTPPGTFGTGYTITGVGQFTLYTTINTTTSRDSTSVSFAVIQI